MVVPVVLFSICRIPSVVKVLWKRINCCWQRSPSLTDFPQARKDKDREVERERQRERERERDRKMNAE